MALEVVALPATLFRHCRTNAAQGETGKSPATGWEKGHFGGGDVQHSGWRAGKL